MEGGKEGVKCDERELKEGVEKEELHTASTPLPPPSLAS